MHDVSRSAVAGQGEGCPFHSNLVGLEHRFTEEVSGLSWTRQLTLERFERRLCRRSDLGFLLDAVEHPKQREEPFLDTGIAADAMRSIDLGNLMWIAILDRCQEQDCDELSIR